MVSILVLMELPLQHIAVTLNIAEYAVSILVLMELPLQQQTDEYDGTVYCCFNPCFNGTTSATNSTRKQANSNTRFQSLF